MKRKTGVQKSNSLTWNKKNINNKNKFVNNEEPEDDEPNTAVTESKKQTITTKKVTMISS